MAERKINFNPGPAILPVPVLEILAKNTVEFGGCGMSIYEISHRSKEFEAVLADAQKRLHELLAIPDSYQVLFLGGGASTQFDMLAMNFLQGGSADYVRAGEWGKKAAKEAELFGSVHLAGDSSADNFNHLPDKLEFDPKARYVHFTSNNTIYGTQYRDFPDVGAVPLICDMSSDILSHRWDIQRFAMIYAGAQKNLGPAGVTVVILRKDMLEKCAAKLPAMLSYKTFADKNSLYNTPPVGPIYIVKLVLDWVAEQGGLAAMEKLNAQKADLLYGMLDGDPEFYRGTVVNKAHRSQMNVPFRLPSEDLEKTFIAEGAAIGLHGMKGHRSVGGIRISMYNALPLAGIEKLVGFMKDFRKAH
ncbi:MAG: 3-phosphoserine/phosphohydroxythreonine transaminase [Pseudomonadota bacterium]